MGRALVRRISAEVNLFIDCVVVTILIEIHFQMLTITSHNINVCIYIKRKRRTQQNEKNIKDI